MLLTSSGQIEVTIWAIGSDHTNHSTLKYKEIEEIYQTNKLTNYLQELYIENITPNGSFCNFYLSTTRHFELENEQERCLGCIALHQFSYFFFYLQIST